MLFSSVVAAVSFLAAAPLQSTFAGGSLDELPLDPIVEATSLIAVSAVTGDVYVAATTTSHDFPATNGGAQQESAGDADVIVVRLNASLTSFLGATYVGGTGSDKAGCIGVHPTTGDVYVCGSTTSADFPVTDASTSSGGANTDGFIAILSGALDTIEAATFIVSTAPADAPDELRGLAFDTDADHIVVIGQSDGSAFAGLAGAQTANAGAADVFVLRLVDDLSAVVGGSFLGGLGDDVPTALVLDGGSVIVGGRTGGPASFPNVAGGAMDIPPDNGGAGFITRLTGDLGSVVDGTLVTGEQFGATVLGLAVDGDDVLASVVANDDLPGENRALPGASTGAIVRFTDDLESVIDSLYLAEDTFPFGISVDAAAGQLVIAGTSRAATLPGLFGGGAPGSDFFVALVALDLSRVVRSAFGEHGAAFRHTGLTRTDDGSIVLAGFAGAGEPRAIDGGAQQQNGGGVDLFLLRFSETLSLPGTCGDGIVDGGETCDDGATAAGPADGDGCSALCAEEPGFACDGEPSVCAEDTGDDDGDGLSNFDEVQAGTDPADSDSDGDGVPDGEDGLGDTDEDGTVDALDTDDDDDGIRTADEVADSGNKTDIDGDGLSNWQDTDSDDDGKDDADEGRGDRDADGVRDYLDPVYDPDGVVDENEDGFADTVHAGGGGLINCQQASGAPLGLLLLGLVFARRRRALGGFLAVVCACVALPVSAHEGGATFPAQRLRPSVDRDGLLEVEGAHVEGQLNADAALWVDYQLNPITLFSRDGDGAVREAALVQHRVDANAVAAVTLVDRLQFAIDVPVVLFQTRDGAALSGLVRDVEDLQAFGVGDPRALVKLRLLRQGADSAADAALILAATAPMQNGLLQAAEPSFIGDKGFTVAPAIALAHTEGPMRFLGNFGVRFREETQLVDVTIGNEVFYAGGAGLSFKDWLNLPLELQASLGGQISLTDPKIQTSPLELLGGATFEILKGVQLFAAVGTGLVAGTTAPDFRALAGVRFSPRVTDADGDGIEDDDDTCPAQAEDSDGFSDDDGCPDPDNDGDGVLDADDGCVDVAEDLDGFDDEDGCPDTDNDGDGLVDAADRCPNEDGTAARGGCPAPDLDEDGVADDGDDKCVGVAGPPETGGCPDRDVDGVLDADDKCPDQPGKKAFGGCPDTDKDGLADPDDKCPTEPETINGVDDTDGCPDKGESLVKVTREKIEILDKVFFDTGKATIKAQSNGLLDQVASVLNANPQLLKVKVEGHTDDQGEDAGNLTLSQERADAVRAYLLTKGVAFERLVAEGFGETRPIGDNKTKAGRDANRRVEFTILEQNVD